jgi:hypothetical protein
MNVDPAAGGAFDFVPPGSMAVLVADRESSVLHGLGLAMAHRDEPLLRQSAHIVAKLMTQNAVTSGAASVERILGAVELEYLDRVVATVVVDAALGFAFVELPYHGGIVDGSAFAAKTHCRPGGSLETIVLVREPQLNGVERLVNAMITQAGDGIWFGGVIYNAIKEIAHHAAHDVDHAVNAFLQTGVEEESGTPLVAAEAQAKAAEAGGSIHRESYGAGGGLALSVEPGIDALIAHRNRILSSRHG